MDEEAEESLNDAEEEMQEEEEEAQEVEAEEEHVEELEEEAEEEEEKEGEEIKREGQNEKQGEDPEESAEHHKQIISQEEHTEKILEEIVKEIEDEVEEELDQGELLIDEERNVNSGIHQILEDLKAFYTTLQNRRVNQVKDSELKELEDLLQQIEEAIEVEYRAEKELRELEKEVRETEAEEERALKLIEEAIEEENMEAEEIQYEGQIANQYQEQQAAGYLGKEYEELHNLEQEKEALAQAITSEVNVELVQMEQELRQAFQGAEGFLEAMEDDVLKLLTGINRELARCERNSSGDKKQRIDAVRSDIEEFRSEAEVELEQEENLLSKEENYMGDIKAQTDKVSAFAKGGASKASTAIFILIGAVAILFVMAQGALSL